MPTPEAEGAAAPTGQISGLAPSGPHAAVRGAYVDFVRRLLASDWDGLVESFAPQVGILGRPQTMERAEIVRRIRQRIDRMQLQGARVEDVLEPREIRVRSVEPDASRNSVLEPGDLLVQATPHLPTRRPFGGWQDSPQLSLVFRRQQGRWVVVATDF